MDGRDSPFPFNSWPYRQWMMAWEHRLANLDPHRIPHPFEWGLEWLPAGPTQLEGGNPLDALLEWNRRAVATSANLFAHPPVSGYRLDSTTLRFPSAIESPSPENNTVWAEYYPAPQRNGRAVLVIPQWNSDDESHLALCRLLNRFGLSTLRMSKAYHHRRRPPETPRADYHVSANLGRTIHATRQSVIDARSCLDWLEQQGYQRLGVIGTSLGSCVALLAAAHDARVRAAVFNHVSPYFADVVWRGSSCRHIRASLEGHVDAEQLRAVWAAISPIHYLERLANRPLRTRLIWATYDSTFLPDLSRIALNRFAELRIDHDTVCLPCGHYTTAKFPFNWMDGLAISKFLHKML